MSKDTFFKDSFTLTASNLTTGVLGFIFSIILSRKLGPEGMGLYGLVMPIYNLFCCLICGGMVTAISKVSAIHFSRNDFRNLNKSIEVSLLFDLIWALLVSILLIFSSYFIGVYIIKDSRTVQSLWVICPALVFVALSSILKGYFYGISKITVPAFIDILEKGIRIIIILTILNLFVFTTIKNTVLAAYISLAVGECISFLLLYTFYKINKNKQSKTRVSQEGRAQLLFNVLVISFPLCLNGFLSTILSTASTLIIPRRLVSTGIPYNEALALIGKFSGMALSITFFPIIVVSSICTILIPDLSQTLSKKDYGSLESRIAQVLKIAFLLGIATMVICFSISDSLGMLFFNRTDLGLYIRFAALSAPFVYCTVTTYGILNGLGLQGVLLRNSLAISILEVLLLYTLTGIPSIHIFGYGISLLLTSFITLVLNLTTIKKKCYVKIYLSDLSIDLLIGILTYFILSLLNTWLPNTLFIFKNVIIILLGFFLLFLSMTISNKRA